MNYIGSEYHIENAKKASVLGNKKIQEIKNERIINYNNFPNFCLNCNNPLSYNKRSNKFCSSSCSATYNNRNRIVTEDHKLKTSLSLKGVSKGGKRELKDYKRNCGECGNVFIVPRIENGKLSQQKYCCDKCSKTGMKKNLSLNVKEKVRNGTHKGWTSRNIISYPEKFFIEVLKNNKLEYKQNFVISKRDLGLNDISNYFLDFYFEDGKIDLEIDGKQHSYKDRKEKDITRDKLLESVGIKVYRIKWKNPINESNKEYLDKEIHKFLKFYEINKLIFRFKGSNAFE